MKYESRVDWVILIQKLQSVKEYLIDKSQYQLNIKVYLSTLLILYYNKQNFIKGYLIDKI